MHGFMAFTNAAPGGRARAGNPANLGVFGPVDEKGFVTAWEAAGFPVLARRNGAKQFLFWSRIRG